MESKEKIPSVSKIGEHYYNFWTSAENPRGLLRRVASLDEFRKKEPAWEVVLDVDKLGKDEGSRGSTRAARRAASTTLINKPIKGSVTRTLISLSPGGSDAIVRREFDLVTKKFVERRRPSASTIRRRAAARGSTKIRSSSARTWAKRAT